MVGRPASSEDKKVKKNHEKAVDLVDKRLEELSKMIKQALQDFQRKEDERRN